PDGPAAEDAAAARAVGRGDERAVGARRGRGRRRERSGRWRERARGGGVSDGLPPISYVRSEDLIDDGVPAARRRPRVGGGVGWRRQLVGLGVALFGLPLLTLLLEHTRGSLALDGQV